MAVIRLIPLALLVLLATVLSLLSGPAEVSGGQLMQAIFSPQSLDEAVRFIVAEVRLPRTGALIVVGGGLALSSLLLQSWFHNPIAEPYNLGLSGGATLGAVLAATLGSGVIGVVPGSFFGVILSALLVFPFVLRSHGAHSHRLILTGVMLSFLLGAVATLVLALDPTGQVGRMFDWLLGAVGTSRDAHWPWAGLCLMIAATLWSRRARELDLLLLPSDVGQQLGLRPRRVHLMIVITVAVLTAWCVAIAGLIGFVGLISPHTARLLLRTRKHALLIPGSVFVGALLLLASDTLARILFADFEIPVGCFMAILGAPALTVLLWSPRGGE